MSLGHQYRYTQSSLLYSFHPRKPKRWWARGLAPGNFWNQKPYRRHFLASKTIAIYLSNSYILPRLRGEDFILAMKWFFNNHPSQKGKLNKGCTIEMDSKQNYFSYRIISTWCEKENVLLRQLNLTLMIQTAVFTVLALGSVNESLLIKLVRTITCT